MLEPTNRKQGSPYCVIVEAGIMSQGVWNHYVGGQSWGCREGKAYIGRYKARRGVGIGVPVGTYGVLLNVGPRIASLHGKQEERALKEYS